MAELSIFTVSSGAVSTHLPEQIRWPAVTDITFLKDSKQCEWEPLRRIRMNLALLLCIHAKPSGALILINYILP